MDTEKDSDNPGEIVLDREQIDHDIAAGAKAYSELMRNVDVDWQRWSATILGLRGLRSLAFVNAGTTKMQSQAYREAMGSLLALRKHSVYDQIEKQTRSDCYRLMDRLEEVDAWYAGLGRDDKAKWKHPSSIVKHCPKEYLSGGMRRHNLPKIGKKKPVVTFETERLKALLIQVIKRLTKYEPQAIDLLDQIHPADPDDPLGDV